MRPDAVAVRRVGFFCPTSTMEAWPESSICVRRGDEEAVSPLELVLKHRTAVEGAGTADSMRSDRDLGERCNDRAGAG